MLLRNGKKPPTFVDTGTLVDVSLTGGAGNGHFVRYVSTSLPEAMASDIDVLLVLDLLCRRRTITAAVAAPIVQRSAATAQGTLERLAAAGIVEPSRRTAAAPFPSYHLADEAMTALGRAVAYRRRIADGLDDKVTSHVREYGFITNQTIRRLFDLDVYSARNMLRDLQQRGLVTKEGDQARGPGVRYVPGPAFPRQGPRAASGTTSTPSSRR